MSACSGEHLHWYLCCPHGEAHRKPLRLQPHPTLDRESQHRVMDRVCGSGLRVRQLHQPAPRWRFRLCVPVTFLWNTTAAAPRFRPSGGLAGGGGSLCCEGGALRITRCTGPGRSTVHLPTVTMCPALSERQCHRQDFPQKTREPSTISLKTSRCFIEINISF